jgi:hypothetical protein
MTVTDEPTCFFAIQCASFVAPFSAYGVHARMN